jgi:hypothetical protein
MFIYLNIYKTADQIDVGKAEWLWSERYPTFEWGFCSDDCDTLVPLGEKCICHVSRYSSPPKWQWTKGVLYLYARSTIGSDGITRSNRNGLGQDYTPYKDFVAEKVHGKLVPGYEACPMDGNPFNLRHDNIGVISKLLMGAVREGTVTPLMALEADEILASFISENCGRGRPKSAWGYNYKGISDVAGIRIGRVRQAASRGKFDPSSLVSVVDFCNNMRKSDKVDGGQ